MIRVTGPRILVALPPKEEETVTAGGIILPRDPDRVKVPTRGIVVQLGEQSGTVDIDDALAVLDELTEAGHALSAARAALKRLGPAPFDVAIGDCVIFSGIVGEELELDGQRYVILLERDVLGIVDPETQEAA